MSEQTHHILKELCEIGDSEIAAHSQRFFKTGRGEYGEGDRFFGIRMPQIRKRVREHRSILLEDVLELLKSPFHEARLLALLVLVSKYGLAGKDQERETIYRDYLTHTEYINNWDLVDCSAEHIVGSHLLEKDRSPLRGLAGSESLWERRIGVMSTFHFIKRGDFSETLVLAELLLGDPQDLMHKAVGWMLREVGNRNRALEEEFLSRHYRNMPRTMLRYAIEKFPETERQAYIRGTVNSNS